MNMNDTISTPSEGQKHTPGPWYAVNYAGRYAIQSTPYYDDTVDLLDEEFCDKAHENASLITNAPETAAALQEAQEEIKQLKAWAYHMNDTYTKAQTEYATKIRNLKSHIASDQKIIQEFSNNLEAVKALSRELWPLWESLAECGETSIGPKFLDNYKRLKERIDSTLKQGKP